MYLDNQTLLSQGQAVTVDAVSTNVVDLGAIRQLGAGEPISVFIAVTVAADTSSGDETYSFEVQTDDNVGFASPTTLIDQDLPRAYLTAGRLIIINLPIDRLERYLRLNYDTGGTTPTITVTAWVAPTSFAQTYSSYADALTIS